MKSLVFFNNKGGVGKTTLACNVASYLNSKMGKRVLLVDADPQCNATQAILSEDLCEEIYLNEDPRYETIFTCLSPLSEGEPSVNTSITPILGSQNRFFTDLIPGHPRMSIIEDRLSDAWAGLRGRDIGGYRITSWCNQLLVTLKNRYDLIVFDVGPSLGALNRSVILSCDYIVTPFGCDIFSLLGIKNISGWIQQWQKQYQKSIDDAKEEHPEIFEKYNIVDDTSKQFRFAGYSVQQYVTRSFKTGRRPVKSYDHIMQQIPGTVNEAMAFLIPEGLSGADLELGHIPNLYSLIPMAQSAKSPIHKLASGDGLVGSQYTQVGSYAQLISSLCDKLLVNVGVSGD
jgi:cellulose biosynthesis protein BcsQ